MAQPVTLIASTTNASAVSGVVNLNSAAIVAKWAVQVVLPGAQPANFLSLGGLSLQFLASVDNVNWTPVQAVNQRGGWLIFDVPAAYVQCSMSGNTATAAVLAVFSASAY